MTMNTREAITVARRSPWLSAQPRSFCDAVCAKLLAMRLKRSETLFHAEDEAPTIYFLVSGAVVSLVPHGGGGLIPAENFLPCDWLGLPAAFARRPRFARTEARRDSLLLRLAVADLLQIAGSDPAYVQAIPNLLTSHMEAIILGAFDLMIADSRARFCARLQSLAGRRTNSLPKPGTLVPLSKEELALTANMSRQRVHEILDELVGAGICDTGYGFIAIRDPVALSRFAG